MYTVTSSLSELKEDAIPLDKSSLNSIEKDDNEKDCCYEKWLYENVRKAIDCCSYKKDRFFDKNRFVKIFVIVQICNTKSLLLLSENRCTCYNENE